MLTFIIDGHSRLRSSFDRCLLEGNSIIWIVAEPSPFQSPEAGRNFVLQHGTYSFRMVKSMGHSRRTLQ